MINLTVCDTTQKQKHLMIEYVIQAQNKFSPGLKELWQYRELFYFFTWRVHFI
ncbi:MAG: hypothetical protein ABIQ07_02900 [Ginsengibacter sp.]